jgi:hypothetical protein
MTSNKLVLGLAAVVLLGLGSCSSEPSDWRPDKKVSVDMVPPGARESYDFDIATDAPSQHKGGAVEAPVSSQMEVPQTLDPAKGLPDKPSADKAMTPEATKVEGSKSLEDAKKINAQTPHDINTRNPEKKSSE